MNRYRRPLTRSVVIAQTLLALAALVIVERAVTANGVSLWIRPGAYEAHLAAATAILARYGMFELRARRTPHVSALLSLR